MSKTVSRGELRILTVPEDTAILRTKSTEIKTIDAELLAFLKNLGATLKGLRKPAGVGLSAIQVGRPIRVFATLLPSAKVEGQGKRDKGQGEEKTELIFYINPEIVSHSQDVSYGEDINPNNEDLRPGEELEPFLEGCLSIPHVYGPVKRFAWVKAKAIVLSEDDIAEKLKMYYNASGRSDYNIFSLSKLGARVFQHELDHLNGILFTDRTIAEGNKLYKQIDKELEPIEI